MQTLICELTVNKLHVHLLKKKGGGGGGGVTFIVLENQVKSAYKKRSMS